MQCFVLFEFVDTGLRHLALDHHVSGSLVFGQAAITLRKDVHDVPGLEYQVAGFVVLNNRFAGTKPQ